MNENEEHTFSGEQDDDLFEHHRIVADKGQGQVRIDKFLFDRLEKTSRTRIQESCDNGFVRVNGTAVKSSYKIKPLDVITIEMPYPVRELELIPENIPLEILYEDDDLIILNKPSTLRQQAKNESLHMDACTYGCISYGS